MNQSVIHIFEAPINHVKRQFTQDCVFGFDGAVFLSTPALVSQLESTAAICLDIAGCPVRVVKHTDMLSLAKKQLEEATTKYTENSAKAKEQFYRLTSVTPVEDEYAE